MVPYADGVPDLKARQYIPNLYASTLLFALYASVVSAFITNTDYENQIQNQGDTVIVRTLPTPVINDYVRGQRLTYTSPDPGSTTFTIDHAKYWAWPINILDKKQSDIAFVEKWADRYSMQLKQVVDRHFLGAIYADAHADNAGDTAGAITGAYNLGTTGASVGLTKSNILDFIVDCGTVLDEQNVNPEGRFMVLPAWAVNKIKKSDLKDASLAGDSRSILRSGVVGMIDSFTIYKSNNLSHVDDTISSGATPVRACNAIFGHKDGITFAQQLSKSETIDNPDDFGQLIRSLLVYGFKVMKPECLGHAYIYNASDAADAA